jgi:hypothetical protein
LEQVQLPTQVLAGVVDLPEDSTGPIQANPKPMPPTCSMPTCSATGLPFKTYPPAASKMSPATHVAVSCRLGRT